jgi:anhydro-N-acetylmuramic acid kinase
MGKSPMLRVIGLMSGTSMDGIDVALVDTDGEDRFERRGSAHFPYDEAFRGRLRQALADAAAMTQRDGRPGCLGPIEQELTELHAAAVQGFIRQRGLAAGDIDLVSFHGQTVLHRPEQQLTVQIGDGALLAARTGIDVVYDLRGADVANGGQGAPLAPIYHRAMAATLRARVGDGAVAVLNIGGVANVTFVGPDGGLLAFDTGPGNALIDDWVFSRTGDGFDTDGRHSGNGQVNETVLAALMDDAFFAAPPPKSLDRNHFSAQHLVSLPVEDGAATLARFTVEAIAVSAQHAAAPPALWIVCGGGRHNPTIMRGLRERLNADVVAAEVAGFDGDAIEAEAWAYLGVRSMQGKAITFPGTTGVSAPMTGGVVART